MTNKFERKVAVILGGSTGDWPRCSKAVCSRRHESVTGQDRKIDVILPNAGAAQLPAFGTVQEKFYCGATRRFAEAHVYKQGPGVVARCAVCKHVVLRLVTSGLR